MGSRFPDARFPLIQDGSSERPGAVKGAPPGAAKRTLYGEDRSERIAKEGNEAFDFFCCWGCVARYARHREARHRVIYAELRDSAKGGGGGYVTAV